MFFFATMFFIDYNVIYVIDYRGKFITYNGILIQYNQLFLKIISSL